MGCTSSKAPDVVTAPPPPTSANELNLPAPAPASTSTSFKKTEAPTLPVTPLAAPAPAPAAPSSSAAPAPAGTPSKELTSEEDDGPNSPRNNESNLESNTETVADDIPLMRYGQLRKQSGGMLVKNWRRRNFTVEKGVLKYYELFIKEYPYGEREKGCFSLKGYTVVQDTNPREPNQILLQSGENKTFDLLIEADDYKKKVRFGTVLAGSSAVAWRCWSALLWPSVTGRGETAHMHATTTNPPRPTPSLYPPPAPLLSSQMTWVAIFSDHITYADKYNVQAPLRLNPAEDAKYRTTTRF